MTGLINMSHPECTSIDMNHPECTSKNNKLAEEKEEKMLEAAEHIWMARAQQKLYQDKVETARTTVNNVHSQQTYT